MSATEKTQELFRNAVYNDDDLGYPADVEFLPADTPWAESALASNLREGMATVLVGEDVELLLIPLRRSPIDRLRGRVPVSVSQRAHGQPTPYATRSRLGRRPLAEMRRLAHA